MENERFKELLDAFSAKRVAIVGDFILDEYLIGETKRVSREAPVIVIDHLESRYHPGGAANAVQNVCALGAAAVAIGVRGGDDNGRILDDLLSQRGADTRGLVPDEAQHTSVKTRILAGELHAQKQQVARIDRSCVAPVDSPALASVVASLDTLLREVDAAVLSDYGLGVLTSETARRWVGACRERGIPVVADSRFNLAAFGGATVATPNEVELFDALQLQRHERQVEVAGRRMITEHGFESLIVTRGSHGMLVFDSSATPRHIGIVGGQDATDVTGAGDTVAASVALTLAGGGSVLEAAEMATYAAAHVVMQRGTATVTPVQLSEVRDRYPAPVEPQEGP